MRKRWSIVAVVLGAATWTGVAAFGAAQAPAPPPAGAAPAPAAPTGPLGALLRALDVDKDGSLTADEVTGTFGRWYAAADPTGAGSITAQQLGGAIDAALPPEAPCGGRSASPRVPCPKDVDAMMEALPATAPAKPKKPRKVLVLAATRGFVHSSIPLAAKTVEEMGKKTGAWTATTSYDATDLDAKTLAQYDAIVLDSTTGFFLDDGNDAAHEARKAALLAFIRGGKGIAGIHAATDSYHGDPETARTGPRPGAGPGGFLGPMIAGQADKNEDKKLTRDELTALGATWFQTMSAGAPRVTLAEAAPRLMAAGAGPARGPRPAGPPPPNVAQWPEWNKIIGGWFKWHWLDPQKVAVRLDDPASPLVASLKSQPQPFEIADEIYTYPMESWSRDNVRVLASIDYARMSDEDKAKEPAATKRTDGDYGLSWIRREGQGRLFYTAFGHAERIYASRPMLEHFLAGIQYALGDLESDATPRPRAAD
jgi:type 1 glutamine amidotransferase